MSNNDNQQVKTLRSPRGGGLKSWVFYKFVSVSPITQA
jgi:hypothetical protein